MAGLSRAVTNFVCFLGLFVFSLNAYSAPLQLAADEARVDVASHLQFREDPGGDLQLPDLIAQGGWTAAARSQGAVNLGYSRSAWWVRLEIVSETAASRYLEVAYPSLDSVAVFVPRASSDYQRLHAGDLLPFLERPLPHRNLVFPIDLPAGKSSLYLRVASAGNLTIPTALWQPQAFHLHNQASYAALAVYYGMLLALGAYNLLLYFSLRDRTYLYYVLFLASMAVGIASIDGLAGQFAWPASPLWTHLALPIGMALSGLFAACFVRSFLNTAEKAPGMDRLFRFFIAWFAGAALLTLVSYRSAEMMTSLGGIGFSTSALVIGVICYRRNYPGARYFLLAWTLILSGSIVLSARNFDWLPSTFLTSYCLQIGSALEMLLLSYALADRINSLRREKELADARLLKLQQEHVAALQQSEQTLEKRVAERTRELAEANTRLESMSRLDLLTGLGNRHELDAAWEKLEGHAKRSQQSIALLLLDLDDFKPINDTHGHHVGDEVLREIAGRLRASARVTDTAVRLGGDEFVLLTSGVTKEDIESISKKMVAAISAPIEVDGVPVTVGVSIGFAIFPSDGGSLHELLRQADTMMYEDKRRHSR